MQRGGGGRNALSVSWCDGKGSYGVLVWCFSPFKTLQCQKKSKVYIHDANKRCVLILLINM